MSDTPPPHTHTLTTQLSTTPQKTTPPTTLTLCDNKQVAAVVIHLSRAERDIKGHLTPRCDARVRQRVAPRARCNRNREKWRLARLHAHTPRHQVRVAQRQARSDGRVSRVATKHEQRRRGHKERRVEGHRRRSVARHVRERAHLHNLRAKRHRWAAATQRSSHLRRPQRAAGGCSAGIRG